MFVSMMFGTLRYDRDRQRAEFIDRTNNFFGDAATEHAACDKCRLKKLRCTGQRSGCDRCKDRGTPCVYSATEGRRSRNGGNKRAHPLDSKDSKDNKHKRRQSSQSVTDTAGLGLKHSFSRAGQDVMPEQDSKYQPPVKQEDEHNFKYRHNVELEQYQPALAEHHMADLQSPWANPALDYYMDLNQSPYDDLDMSINTDFVPESFAGACDLSLPSFDRNYQFDNNLGFLSSYSPLDTPNTSGPGSEITTSSYTHPPGSPAQVDKSAWGAHPTGVASPSW